MKRLSTRAKQRHGGNGDTAGLENAEPRREQHERIGAAEQDAIAGDEAVIDQCSSDLARCFIEPSIGPAAVGIDDREIAGLAALQQYGGGVEALRIIKRQEIRQLVGLGKSLLYKRVSHSGTTAVASISTKAELLTRALTSTSAIAG